jgi:HK97 family phage major capsid protein
MTPEDLKQLNANLKETRDDIARHAERADKESKRLGDMSAETKQSVDALLAEQTAINARIAAAEQALAAADSKPKEKPAKLTPGQIAAQSEAVKALISNMAQVGQSARIDVSASIPAIRAAITSATSSAGDLLVPQYDGLVAPARRRFRIMDLINKGRTGAQTVNFVRETTHTNNAAPVSENPASAKPTSVIAYDATEVSVKTIAHIIKASKQILDDVPMLQSEINATMLYMLEYVLEEQLLTGSGVGLNLNGLYTQATSYSNPGVNVQKESAIDRLRVALLQAALTNRTPDGIVLNPIDWADIELTKDTSDKYIWANPQAMGGPVLWGLPVVETAAMTADTFLVGAFRAGATYYDREQMNVVIATQNEDDFVKNMLTIRAETRGTLAVKMPEAFIKGDFAGVESE